MFDAVFGHLPADVLGFFLRLELGRVNSDHHKLILVFLLEPGQVWKNVMAVDAAISPEIKQDDLALKLGEVNWTGVDPADRSVEAGLRILAERDQLNPSLSGLDRVWKPAKAGEISL
jgi:hypothetical protein